MATTFLDMKEPQAYDATSRQSAPPQYLRDLEQAVRESTARFRADPDALNEALAWIAETDIPYDDERFFGYALTNDLNPIRYKERLFDTTNDPNEGS